MYARVTFTQGNLGQLEIGMDGLDDPANLEHLIRNLAVLWKIAEEGAE